MSNSSMGYAHEPTSTAEGLFSPDATRRAIEQEFVGRFFTLVRVPPASEGSPAARLRKLVDALDAGELDHVVEQLDRDATPAIPQRFDEVPEFDYDAWRKRHR